MQIFYSDNSPYARIVRIAVLNAGLADRVERIKVRNRSPDSPLLAYSPVCRVPTLVKGDLVLGEARNICGYFDALTGSRFIPDDADWTVRGLESLMVGFLDGISVWVRELRRDPAHRSGFILDVEAARAARCLDHFETVRSADSAAPPWDFGHIALACGLDLMDLNALIPDWSTSRPLLGSWIEERRELPAMQATKPIMAATQQSPLG